MRGEKRLTLDKNSLIFLTKGGVLTGTGKWAGGLFAGSHGPASDRAILSSKRVALHPGSLRLVPLSVMFFSPFP